MKLKVCFTLFLISVVNCKNEYDFVIVGGGTSGLVLASRLSEINKWKILLIEAGNWTNIQYSPSDSLKYLEYGWKFETQPQENSCLGLKNKTLFWHCGKQIGGTSQTNFMMYTRGNKHDFDLWGEENLGWKYDDVFPYFLKAENYNFAKFNKKYHRKNGKMTIDTPYTSGVTEVFLNASKELGFNNLDYNGGNQNRFSKLRSYISYCRRNGVKEEYLSSIKQRKNLRILHSSYVTKVIINPKSKIADGIIFLNKHGKLRKVKSKEIILTAGVVKTSQLLMLSGIGIRKDLEQFNIQVIEELPVGENVADHIGYFGMNYLANIQNTTHKKSTIASCAGFESVGFVSLENKFGRPNFEILAANNIINDNFRILTNVNDTLYDKIFEQSLRYATMNIFPILLHPKSRGKISLKNKNPFDQPIINPNYFSDENDIKSMVEAVKFVKKLEKTNSFNKVDAAIFPVPICDEYAYESDDYWKCSIKTLTMSFNDFCGSCRMGKKDKNSVVDNNLKVHGIKNLRVADNSVIPVTISGHLGSIAVMIAEKTADIIKSEYKINK